jgi:hypothetical protein
VRGPPPLDIQADIVSADELVRRLDIPKTTLYGWRYKNKGGNASLIWPHLRRKVML